MITFHSRKAQIVRNMKGLTIGGLWNGLLYDNRQSSPQYRFIVISSHTKRHFFFMPVESISVLTLLLIHGSSLYCNYRCSPNHHRPVAVEAVINLLQTKRTSLTVVLCSLILWFYSNTACIIYHVYLFIYLFASTYVLNKHALIADQEMNRRARPGCKNHMG